MTAPGLSAWTNPWGEERPTPLIVRLSRVQDGSRRRGNFDGKPATTKAINGSIPLLFVTLCRRRGPMAAQHLSCAACIDAP